MFIFGGRGQDCVKFNDVWVLDTLRSVWHQVDIGQAWIPEMRSGHSMFFYREKMVVYGGINRVLDEMSDMAILDPVTSKWT